MEVDKVPTEVQLDQLRNGVVITTPIQSDSGSKSITSKTLPCEIFAFPGSRRYQITLIEGRNRQIRRMAEAVGLEVIKLHRISFAGITLKGLTVGKWNELNSKEMTIVSDAITSSLGAGSNVIEDEESLS